MLISLYVDRGAACREYSVFFDIDRMVVIRRTTLIGRPAESRESVIGGSSELETDRLLLDAMRDAVRRGGVVLYGYLPSPDWPLTSAFLRETAGVEVEPDLTDGLPIRRPGTGRRGGRATYLLFTVLSSVAM